MWENSLPWTVSSLFLIELTLKYNGTHNGAVVKVGELVVGNCGIGNVAVLMGSGSAQPVPSRTGVLVTERGLLVATGWARLLLSRNTREYRVAGAVRPHIVVFVYMR